MDAMCKLEKIDGIEVRSFDADRVHLVADVRYADNGDLDQETANRLAEVEGTLPGWKVVESWPGNVAYLGWPATEAWILQRA